MENGNNNGVDEMLNELLQGLELTKQVQNQIANKPTSSLSDHNQEALNYSLLLFFIEKLMSTFDKTITLAKQMNLSNPNNNNHALLEAPQFSDVNSSRSENSLPPNHPRKSKRRKLASRTWSKTVLVGPDKSISGLEGPFSDGFSWRKYGQKQILGAKFPRGYYRCTHRHSRGCEATKKVQQSDEDPSTYQVMYHGEHKCNITQQQQQAHSSPHAAHTTSITQPQPLTSPHQLQPIIQEVYLGLGPEGDLKIESGESTDKAHMFRCFSFKSALLETGGPFDNCILGSPTTSGSNYFSGGLGLNVQTSGSDFNDPISGPNSVTNSPTVGQFEFPLEHWQDIEPTFF